MLRTLCSRGPAAGSVLPQLLSAVQHQPAPASSSLLAALGTCSFPADSMLPLLLPPIPPPSCPCPMPLAYSWLSRLLLAGWGPAPVITRGLADSAAVPTSSSADGQERPKEILRDILGQKGALTSGQIWELAEVW